MTKAHDVSKEDETVTAETFDHKHYEEAVKEDLEHVESKNNIYVYKNNTKPGEGHVEVVEHKNGQLEFKVVPGAKDNPKKIYVAKIAVSPAQKDKFEVLYLNRLSQLVKHEIPEGYKSQVGHGVISIPTPSLMKEQAFDRGYLEDEPLVSLGAKPSMEAAIDDALYSATGDVIKEPLSDVSQASRLPESPISSEKFEELEISPEPLHVSRASTLEADLHKQEPAPYVSQAIKEALPIAKEEENSGASIISASVNSRSNSNISVEGLEEAVSSIEHSDLTHLKDKIIHAIDPTEQQQHNEIMAIIKKPKPSEKEIVAVNQLIKNVSHKVLVENETEALTLAINKGHEAIVKSLLEAGVRPTKKQLEQAEKNYKNDSGLYLTVEQKQQKIIAHKIWNALKDNAFSNKEAIYEQAKQAVAGLRSSHSILDNSGASITAAKNNRVVNRSDRERN